MRKPWIWMLTLLVLLVVSVPATAQEPYSPPEGATLVGSLPTVTFRWPRHEAAKAYYLEVFASGQPLYSQPVAGTSVSVALRFGPPYLWRVKAFVGGRFEVVGGDHHFNLSSQLEYAFNGSDGSGGRGEDVQVTLQPAGDFIRARLQGSAAAHDFLLLPSSEPLQVFARGGRGAAGAPGSPGYPGRTVVQYDAGGNPANRTFVLPTPGGPGGAGGPGGSGGIVRVSGQGVDGRRYVRASVDGGAGGPGGAGGRGGAPGVVPGPGYGTYTPPSAYYEPAPGGPPGPDGAAGPAGQLLYD